MVFNQMTLSKIRCECSSELAELIPLAFASGKSTCYFDRLLDFSANIPGSIVSFLCELDSIACITLLVV